MLDVGRHPYSVRGESQARSVSRTWPLQFHNEADDEMKKLGREMTLGVGVLSQGLVALPLRVVE